ncbi:hypothetical protein HAX54_051488, partial [Datura stramonium]|nr:hypothetical protein [Datura stramonium]
QVVTTLYVVKPQGFPTTSNSKGGASRVYLLKLKHTVTPPLTTQQWRKAITS